MTDPKTDPTAELSRRSRRARRRSSGLGESAASPVLGRRAHRAQGEADEQGGGQEQQGDQSPPVTRASRAGRNLTAAITVGVTLGAVIIASLVIWKPAFVVVVTIAVVLATWELIEALGSRKIAAPVLPTLLGAAAIPPIAYLAGSAGLAMAVTLSVALIVIWRALDGLTHALRDIAGGVFIIVYICLMAGIALLMLREDDGVGRVFVFLIVTVVSDIGGYTVGVLFGRHPMAPSVSPKKSWEGFAGSVACCMIAGVLTITLILGGPWWGGILLGAAVAVFATIGDLSESTIKRDLGIKDMGTLLPGHGGVNDRLDSLVVTAPVSWMLLHVLVPV